MLLALVLTGHVMRHAFEGFVGAPMSRLRLLGFMYSRGELSQADLQRHLEVDGATITRQVKQMEAEGLLQRRADPKDNRFTLVALTDAGRELVKELVARGQEFQHLAIQNIDEQQLRDAVAVLAQMRGNLQALAGRDRCPAQPQEDA
jgi:DNA-binding MarR family transcriptional regulator